MAGLEENCGREAFHLDSEPREVVVVSPHCVREGRVEHLEVVL